MNINLITLFVLIVGLAMVLVFSGTASAVEVSGACVTDFGQVSATCLNSPNSASCGAGNTFVSGTFCADLYSCFVDSCFPYLTSTSEAGCLSNTGAVWFTNPTCQPECVGGTFDGIVCDPNNPSNTNTRLCINGGGTCGPTTTSTTTSTSTTSTTTTSTTTSTTLGRRRRNEIPE